MNAIDQWHYLIVTTESEDEEAATVLHHPEGCAVTVSSEGFIRYNCATAQSLDNAGYYGMFDRYKDIAEPGTWRIRPWIERIPSTPNHAEDWDGGWFVEAVSHESRDAE